tara:strand:+ start:847 stop:1500 length:654 start_codon:yes stop_codon:yes gene_type:complete
MDKFRGEATFAKINENIEQLQFPGSLTLGDVGAVIALAGVHREALFFGVSKKQLTISLNKTQLLQPVTEEDVQLQQNGKRRRIENPLQEKLDKTMVALSEKIKDEVRVRHARHLLKAITTLKDVSTGAPAVDTFSVFLKADALVFLKIHFRRGARINLSVLSRALGDCADGALSKSAEDDDEGEVLLLLNLSAIVSKPAASSETPAAAPAPPGSPAA